MGYQEIPLSSWRDKSSLIFVLAIWLSCTLVTFWLTETHSSELPWCDDYEDVPFITGNAVFSFHWLWAPHAEHRIILPKLSRYVLLCISGSNFKTCVYPNTVILSFLALVTCIAAARLRGRFSFSDAMFPLILLGWGQGQTFLWGALLHFVLWAMFTTFVLIAIVSQEKLESKPAAFMGWCLFLLGLCGAQGLITAFPITIWLCLATVIGIRRGGSRLDMACWISVILAILSIFAYDTVYFLGGLSQPSVATLLEKLRSALAYLGGAFGPMFSTYWAIRGSVMVFLMISVTAIICRGAWKRPSEYLRAAGLLAFLSSFVLSAAAVAHGRGHYGIVGAIQPRYTTLLVPLFCAFYFSFQLYTFGKLSRIAQYALFLIALLTNVYYYWAPPFDVGLFKSRAVAFRYDLDSGIPAFMLAEKYYTVPFWLYPDPEVLEDYLHELKDARVGWFAEWKPSLSYKRITLSEEDVRRHLSQGAIPLDSSRKVLAMRIYLNSNVSTDRMYRIEWCDGDFNADGAVHRGADFRVSSDPSFIRIDDRLKQFRFARDNALSESAIKKVVIFVADPD